MAQKFVTVTVNVGVGITVNPTNPVELQKNQDTVQWKGTSGTQFNIEFPNGSSEPPVTCNMQGSKWVCEAGPFPNTTGKKRTIKYDVTSSGTPTLDPELEVFP